MGITTRQATELASEVPPWLPAGRVVREPERSDIRAPVEPQAIVELYSRT
jgi:hypothetical protein